MTPLLGVPPRVPCDACRSRIDQNWDVCPACGAEDPHRRRRVRRRLGAVAIVVALLAAALLLLAAPRAGAQEVAAPDGGGADIGPLVRQGVPGMGLRAERERYFRYHHTGAGTLDELDPVGFAGCVAAMAVMAWVVADLPEPLPR